MLRCQTVTGPLPRLWLISDARNDAGLEQALVTLPRGSGLIFRHYHLPPKARRARFQKLAGLARRKGHLAVLAGTPQQAVLWGADGAYGTASTLQKSARGKAGLKLATAHDLRECVAAKRAGADAVLLSPVFATRSHPGACGLGPVRFWLLAQKSALPVIALGGMNARTARRLQWPRWAAIDGLVGGFREE